MKMMKPDINLLIIIMFSILIVNLLTTKTSVMCLNLAWYTMNMSMIISMKFKMTPIPFIVFLTMIGGLMILFLYLAATLWTKKEILTMKTKIMLMSMLMVPTLTAMKFIGSTMSPIHLNVFDPTFNMMTSLLMILILMILSFAIEIHTKMDHSFRQKPKIWE